MFEFGVKYSRKISSSIKNIQYPNSSKNELTQLLKCSNSGVFARFIGQPFGLVGL